MNRRVEPGQSRPGDSADSRSGERLLETLRRELEGEVTLAVPPIVPDHELLRRIGRGAYGDVWLARSALGTFRAVKVVYRARFKDDRPYEREFQGILKYEPVSRTHEGLVHVLHVGRNDPAGCFYYVMELADAVERANDLAAEHGDGSDGSAPIGDLQRTASVPDESYQPRTLRSELGTRLRLPPEEAAQLASRIGGALAHLHGHGLVHRDIKPANIIFVSGRPKLADIGLVTDAGDSRSFVGTEGFIPPEGPGSRQADLYGLGKVLYELASGRDRLDFPQLPGDLLRLPEMEALLELNEVMTRACAPLPANRYASVVEFLADLGLFLAGRSLRRARNIERNLERLKRVALAAAVVLAVTAVFLWLARRETHYARGLAEAANERARLEAEIRVRESSLRQRAELAERATQHQLYLALLAQARATVRSGEMGHRMRALDALRRAAAISNSFELRGEVIAAMTLPDLRFESELPFTSDYTLRKLDPTFERIALCRRNGDVEIRSTRDSSLIVTLPASKDLPAYSGACWSDDGALLAVKRDHDGAGSRATWEVWHVATAERLLLLEDVSWATLSFHPRRPWVIAGRWDGWVEVWDWARGTAVRAFAMKPGLTRLGYSPDGEQLVVVRSDEDKWVVSVNDSSNGVERASAVVSSEMIQSVSWNPDGRHVVVPDHGGVLHSMDTSTGVLREFGRQKGEAARAFYSPEGDYLFSGSWDNEIVCWDAHTRQRIFTIGVGGYQAQMRADGAAFSVLTDSGVQLYAFERPRGVREFAEPLGVRLRHAAFSADGRWLAASAAERMGIWDLEQGGPGAVREEGYEAHFYFTSDGRELYASRSNARDTTGYRWRISAAAKAGGPPEVTSLPLYQPPGFTFLCLHSNAVMMTGTNGSHLLTVSEIELGPSEWSRTAPGLNEVSPDGRWLAINRSYSSSAYVYALPDLKRVTRLSHPANIGSFDFMPGSGALLLSSKAGVEFWSTTTWERTRVLTNFMRVTLTGTDDLIWLQRDWHSAGLYETATLEPRLMLPYGMIPMAVSANGRRLAVSVDGRRLQVWDLGELKDQLAQLKMDWPDKAGRVVGH